MALPECFDELRYSFGGSDSVVVRVRVDLLSQIVPGHHLHHSENGGIRFGTVRELFLPCLRPGEELSTLEVLLLHWLLLGRFVAPDDGHLLAEEFQPAPDLVVLLSEAVHRLPSGVVRV